MKGEPSSDAGHQVTDVFNGWWTCRHAANIEFVRLGQKMDVGSMGHLAQSLLPMAWPTQVIADAGRKRHKADDEDRHQSAVASTQYDSIVGVAQEYPIARTPTTSLPRQAFALPSLVGPPSDHEDVELLYLL